jgi:hypothetical protein
MAFAHPGLETPAAAALRKLRAGQYHQFFLEM